MGIVNENIKKYRLKKGLTLEALAELVGTSKQTIQRYESGVIGNIPSDKIEKISEILTVSPAILMGWERELNEQEKEDSNIEIAQKIKERREYLNLSQEDLANKLGYKSRSSINKIEMGLSDIPFSKIKDFAKALETTPAHLMGWTEEEERINLLNKREKLQYDELMKQNAMFFNDENISEEDKAKLLDAMQEAFFTVKLLNKRKK